MQSHPHTPLVHLKCSATPRWPNSLSEAAPEPSGEEEEGLAAGQYRCSFEDSTGSYNRLCSLSADSAGGLKLSAPGTRLNPEYGFEGHLKGGPGVYQFRGKIKGFENCVGDFDTTAERRGDHYEARSKLASGCTIAIAISATAKASAPVGEALDLAPGRHRCSFQDSTGTYNRVCTLSGQGAGSLKLNAPGTRLNPDYGFSGTLEKSGGSYRFRGNIKGFENCVGAFDASAEPGGGEYVARTKLTSGCSIAIRIKAATL